MSYVFSIGPIIEFAELNKDKVMHLDKNERMDAMIELIREDVELTKEFEDRCCDELEDTEYELMQILKI